MTEKNETDSKKIKEMQDIQLKTLMENCRHDQISQPVFIQGKQEWKFFCQICGKIATAAFED